MTQRLRRLLVAFLASVAVSLAPVAAQNTPSALIANGRWDCVQGARVTAGTLVLTGGAGAFTTLNDYAVRLETTRTVTVSLTLESNSDPGFVGLNLWNSLPAAGDAANWYSTAAKVSIGLVEGRPSLRVYDGTSNMPAYQVAARPPAPSGPVQISVSREGDELVFRAAGAEIGRTKILGSLTGGPLFFGPVVAANRTVTIHRFAVTDAEHPDGAEIIPAVAPSPPSTATNTLKAAAANTTNIANTANGGHDIGVGLSQRPLRWDARVREVAAREFSMFEGIDAFVFNVMRPARDKYRFCAADQIVAFAEANHVPAYAGSGLLWGSNPAWLTEGHFSRAELIDIMHEHIQTVVGRYRGRVRIWNVVNEVHDNVGGLQKGDQQIWMRVIGPEYVDMAFRWAHEADPQALLVFNSYGDEGMTCAAHCGPGHAPGSRNLKADGLYTTVRGMLQRGVPIHGVGMQMHRGDLPSYPESDPKSIAAQMKRLGDLGLNVYITEMDVPVQKPVTAAKLANQAAFYGTILRTCLAAPNCKSLIVFGVDDGNWSEPPSFARGGSTLVGQLTAPLLFDAAFNAKPAYQAMLTALRSK